MRFLLFFLPLVLAACVAPGSVTLSVGPVHATVSAASLALPAAFRDGSTMPARLASVPCDASMPCPAPATGDPIVLECNTSSVCDPAVTTLEAPLGDVVDIDMASGDLRGVLSVIDYVEISAIAAQISDETLTLDLAPVDVYWGPEGATTIDPANHVATLPGIPAGTPAGDLGTIPVDAAGATLLSDYLVHTSHRVRLFARTTVDLAPGGLFPDGSLGVDVLVTLIAHGKIAG